jgi:hypothetical protein
LSVRTSLLALVAALAGVLSADASAGVHARRPGPREAAAALVAHMHPARVRHRGCSFGASKVAPRGRRLWLAVGISCYRHEDELHTRVRMYVWSGTTWRLDGTVTGPLGPSQWVDAASLTHSRAPDFAIQGCGAGDTNCLSVVSKRGGRWHAVPFEYGYGRSLEVNGSPRGHVVETAVDACGCAGGPSTWTFERYAHDRFVPTPWPDPAPSCSTAVFERIVDGWEEKVLRFTRVGCAGGWALAVGDGAGFPGPVVALFDRGVNGRAWHLLTLDAGNALPAAPSIYDLPLKLLARLAAPAGATLAPQIAAARLIARLQTQYRFEWPLQNGLVEAGGQRWLIAVVPVAPPRNHYEPPPVGAVIYRWDGTSWVEDGRIAHLSHHLNVDDFGGWFISVPAPAPAVAFELVQSCCTKNVTDHAHSTAVITNAGGSWQVGPLPRPSG